jgi:very-short-patch-repair endonuclease
MEAIDKKIEAVLLEAAVLAQESLPEEFLGMCESPIERLFLCALWARGSWTGRVELVHLHSAEALEHYSVGLSHIIAAPQVRVGPYRVDFMLIGQRVDREPPCVVVVECDGHEFHEKTKEQAARDKARDRDLQERGMQVFRFAGSEVWRAAGDCAGDVILQVHSEIGESLFRFMQRRSNLEGAAQ